MNQKTGDLERARRLRALDAKARKLFANNPALSERTRRFLEGEIMPKAAPQNETILLTVRVPSGLPEEADGLIAPIAADPSNPIRFGRATVTRATVIRLALDEGLRVLRRRYAKGQA